MVGADASSVSWRAIAILLATPATVGVAKKLPEDVLRFFKRTGSKGGKARAERHTSEELSQWGKLGGQPPKRKTPPKRGR